MSEYLGTYQDTHHETSKKASVETSALKFPSKDWLEPRLVVVTLVAILLSLLSERAGAPAWVTTLFNILSYVAGGAFGLIEGLKSLAARKIDVDLLMVLAALGAASIGDWREGAILLFLFSLSNVLQAYAIGRSRDAIRALLKLYPSQAKVRRDDRVQIMEVSQIRVGEIVLIEPGERIPVDGVVRAGHSSVDQAPITGESMPVEKLTGDKVFAGTLNQQGALDVEATQPATDTVLSRIIKLVEEAQDTKAPTERFLEAFEQRYALIIIVAVGLLIVIPPALGLVDFVTNFYRAMVLMTVASPCALVISTPASFISAIAAAARNGVLFKGGAYLEGLAAIKAVAFDKTGTLTLGRPSVTAIVPANGMSENDVLRIVASAEMRSEHPLAQALVRETTKRGEPIAEIANFQAVPGKGVVGTLDGETIRVGSPAFMAQFGDLPADLTARREQLELGGNTVIGARQGDRWLGLVALADTVRPEAQAMIQHLHNSGVKVAMLTGDNARVAQAIAQHLGVDEVYAELLPDNKVAVIKTIGAKFGPVAMVGDGVNDAPALATADIGIAMGAAGTDVALETADLVLMGDRLGLIPYAIRLSKKARRIVWQNIGFSILVVVVLIISTFAIGLALPLGVLGHEGSTVIVVLNGLIGLLLLPELQRRRTERTAAR